MSASSGSTDHFLVRLSDFDAKRKLNLTLGGVFFFALVALGGFLYPWLHQKAASETKASARLQMETAQAIRKYTTDHIRDLLLKDDSVFHPQSVPSYAANTTLSYLGDAYPGYKYREVAINPTNPSHKANESEALAISRLGAAGQDESFFTAGTGDVATLHYMKAIRVSSESCLKCHGDVKDAPQAILSRYGSSGGFGWKVGEVIGAQVVSVPAAAAAREANRAFITYMTIALGSFLLSFLVLNFILSRIVLSPMEVSNTTLKRMAEEDVLTGLANRRSFMARLEHEVMNASIVNVPLSVIALDLDHFKKINDLHGHFGGDMALKEVAKRLGAKVRRSDMIGRLGGEEFAILLPCTDEVGAARLAEHLREALASEPIGEIGRVTGSFGVAQFDPGSDDAASLLSRADKALYAAKEAGRNCVSILACEPQAANRSRSCQVFRT